MCGVFEICPHYFLLFSFFFSFFLSFLLLISCCFSSRLLEELLSWCRIFVVVFSSMPLEGLHYLFLFLFLFSGSLEGLGVEYFFIIIIILVGR